MTESQTSSQATGSHDAVIEGFLQLLDDAPDEETIAILLSRAVADHPERADEFHALVAGFKNLRGLRDPDRLGPYRIRRVLAVGGMGKLYEAEEDDLPRVVAVKTIKSGRIADPHLRDRFERERLTLARLHHTNIVPIYATGHEAGLLYFSMPRIHGPSLRALIKAASSLPSAAATPPSASTFEQLVDEASAEEVKEHAGRAVTEVDGFPDPEVIEPPNGHPAPLNVPRDYHRRICAMMADVAAAVHHAHQAGIIHRDLKPANILVERQGHPWVLDFGLAHLQEDLATASTIAESNGRTDPAGPTVGVGTPLYWAPEQVPPSRRPPNADPPPAIDHRTDVWGLGATLFELLTLRRPFTGIDQILTEPPHSPNHLVARFPRELTAVCLKALEKDPKDRYPTADALAGDLRRWLEVRPTAAGEAAIRRKTTGVLGWARVWLRRLGFWSRRRPTAAGLVLAVLLIGGMGIAYAAHVKQLELINVRAETKAAEHREKLTKAQLEAAEHERNSLAFAMLPQLRRSIRRQEWFQKSSEIVSNLHGTSIEADGTLQSHAAAALEGIDARTETVLRGGVGPLAFDPASENLLLVRNGVDGQRRPWTRTVLWQRSTQQPLVERDLGEGVPAFRPDGTPVQFSWDRNDRARLRLYDVKSGKELGVFGCPLAQPSAFGAIATSSDGSRLAAVACPTHREKEELVLEQDGTTTIAVWDATSEKPIKTLEHKATQDVVLSPDGRLLAAWDHAGEITVWRLPDGKRLAPFRVGRCPVSCAAFGRDPVWHEDDSVTPWLLGVAESTGLVTVWDLNQNRPRSTCHGSEFAVSTMDFSEDGALLLTAGRTTRLWDVATGNCLLEMRGVDFCRSVSFAPDGRHCALSANRAGERGEPGSIVVELELGHGIRTLYGLGGVVERSAFSPDRRLIAAASHEWDVGLWERESGRLLGVLPGPIGLIADSIGMAFDPSGKRFACSMGNEARLWDIPQRRLIRSWKLPGGLCDSLAFSGEDHLYLVRQELKGRQGAPTNQFPSNRFPRTVRLYDLLSPTPMKPLAEIDHFNLHVHGIRIAPNGSVFAVDGLKNDQGHINRMLKFYGCKSGRQSGSLPTRVGIDRAAWFFFDPNVKIFAVPLGDETNLVTLFSLPSLEYRGVTKAPMACLSPDARWSMEVISDQPPALALFDVAAGSPVMRMVQDTPVRQVSFNFSPDGRHVIFGRKDGTVSLLDLVEMNKQLTKLHLGW